jgi:hypothetical protein
MVRTWYVHFRAMNMYVYCSDVYVYVYTFAYTF